MEGILYQRMSPLLKCVVLFLFIFTAKVLTTRPQETQDGKNSIHQQKTNHFVRTFTKYHHRRTIQWNQDHWPSDDQPKVIQKRNAEFSRKIVKRNVFIPNSNEFIDSGKKKYPLSPSESLRNNFEKAAISINDNDNSVSNKITKNKYKVKQAITPTSAPVVRQGSTIKCLYKTNRISFSSTPSYEDDQNAQFVVENESFEIGRVSNETLPNGETLLAEQCTDPRAYCYTLWHQDGDGNVTVLGQGCWRSAARAGPGGCDICTPTARLPNTKFCCCTTSFCNTDILNLQDATVTMKAESTLEPMSHRAAYSGAAVSGVLILLILLAIGAVLHNRICKRHVKDTQDLEKVLGFYILSILLAIGAVLHNRICKRNVKDTQDLEKVDVMGSGPDSLATGLLCVDNLTLNEHIGSGKFGSVWRGSLGGAPVAVKLHTSAATWRKEANIYTTPHLAHPNILRYYGSDTRATLDGGREYLLVLELCTETLRSRLTRDTLSWAEFANIAHGLAAALAHLHTPGKVARPNLTGNSLTDQPNHSPNCEQSH
ncbi:hypothetical protein O0L34_g13254 [Tuta absoluta]|nr:hypothetical protein O0L34_g13254 [Tuta absoluta]